MNIETSLRPQIESVDSFVSGHVEGLGKIAKVGKVDASVKL